MSLNFSLLKLIISRLDEGWQRYQQNTSDLQIRDGLIQRFEWAYSICMKSLRIYLEDRLSRAEEVHLMDFDQLIRRAWSLGLLNEEIAQWRIFREKIIIAAQSYDEEKAIEVCNIIPQFLVEAQYLCATLLKRQTQ